MPGKRQSVLDAQASVHVDVFECDPEKGVLANDNNIFDWFSQLGLNTIKRETVTICLLDETAKPTMDWTLSNAFSVKLAGTEVSAVDNETAVETIELAYTGITIANG